MKKLTLYTLAILLALTVAAVPASADNNHRSHRSGRSGSHYGYRNDRHSGGRGHRGGWHNGGRITFGFPRVYVPLYYRYPVYTPPYYGAVIPQLEPVLLPEPVQMPEPERHPEVSERREDGTSATAAPAPRNSSVVWVNSTGCDLHYKEIGDAEWTTIPKNKGMRVEDPKTATYQTRCASGSVNFNHKVNEVDLTCK